MQRVKQDFYRPNGGHHGSLQSCVRTNDIERVGDGSHLTYFEMLGNFSFGGHDYEESVELWHCLLGELGIRDQDGCHIRVHPTETWHHDLWIQRGYHVELDEQCVWSDGMIGGFCCEVFVGDLEIGNLVNPLGHSTDVGFGLERLHRVIERKDRVDQTSLFDQEVHPVISDHCRTLDVMWENGIQPGNRGRSYICRRLIRRLLRLRSRGESLQKSLPFSEWIESEYELRERNLNQGRRLWSRHSNKSPQFWWETFGVLPEEIELLRE